MAQSFLDKMSIQIWTITYSNERNATQLSVPCAVDLRPGQLHFLLFLFLFLKIEKKTIETVIPGNN